MEYTSGAGERKEKEKKKMLSRQLGQWIHIVAAWIIVFEGRELVAGECVSMLCVLLDVVIVFVGETRGGVVAMLKLSEFGWFESGRLG